MINVVVMSVVMPVHNTLSEKSFVHFVDLSHNLRILQDIFWVTGKEHNPPIYNIINTSETLTGCNNSSCSSTCVYICMFIT